jgi:hypothetical protein
VAPDPTSRSQGILHFGPPSDERAFFYLASGTYNLYYAPFFPERVLPVAYATPAPTVTRGGGLRREGYFANR